MTITLSYLRQILKYDPATGEFWWAKRTDVPAWWNGRYAGKKTGSLDAYGYLVLRINGKTYKAHRIAWVFITGSMPELEIDHKNGDRKDNSAQNLREATDLENAVNACVRLDNRSGIKGVSWHRGRGKWQAQINQSGKRKSLGYFDSKSEAGAAYQSHALALHGEFVRL